MDITDEDNVVRAVHQVTADVGGIDILLNSAGIAGAQYPVTELPPLSG